MASHYKCIYFNIKGLGEAIRYLLSYGGDDFEDVRITKGWPALKSSTPFGKLPILEADGKTGHQSLAICRYLAKQFKLTGKDDWEDLEIDSIVDSVIDICTLLYTYLNEPDIERKEQLKKPLFEEHFPYYLNKFDAIVKSNNGYLVGRKLTWADLYFTATFEVNFVRLNEDVLSQYSNLKALVDKVKTIPNIKAWIEKSSQQ